MTKKVLTILQVLICSIGLINLGMVIVFIFYGKHMCCDKISDGLIYAWIMVGCMIVDVIVGIIKEVMLKE